VLVVEDGKLIDLAGRSADLNELYACDFYTWSNDLAKFVKVTIPQSRDFEAVTISRPQELIRRAPIKLQQLP
jgi:hypothetical protein